MYGSVSLTWRRLTWPSLSRPGRTFEHFWIIKHTQVIFVIQLIYLCVCHYHNNVTVTKGVIKQPLAYSLRKSIRVWSGTCTQITWTVDRNMENKTSDKTKHSIELPFKGANPRWHVDTTHNIGNRISMYTIPGLYHSTAYQPTFNKWLIVYRPSTMYGRVRSGLGLFVSSTLGFHAQIFDSFIRRTTFLFPTPANSVRARSTAAPGSSSSSVRLTERLARINRCCSLALVSDSRTKYTAPQQNRPSESETSGRRHCSREHARSKAHGSRGSYDNK